MTELGIFSENYRESEKPPIAELLWLETKQIIRDPKHKSEFFPDLTYAKAVAIRQSGLEKLREILKED